MVHQAADDKRSDQARPEELGAAFRLVFARLRRDEREYRTAKALELVARGELDPAGVFVVRGQSGLLGAMACALVPGAGGIVWPPLVFPGPDQTRHEAHLISAACTWLRRGGAKLAQCLLSHEEQDLGAPLLRHGFRFITQLSYLAHDLSSSPTGSSVAETLSYEAYDPSHPDCFHRTLERTYEQTLDCPEVNGVRRIEEVIEGHRAQGRFDPSRWWLVRWGETPVGLIILVEQEGGAEWEVAYMGVVPEARRQGVGRAILMRGVEEARRAGITSLILCVDERNLPALHLYTGLGFHRRERRAVLLRVWS